MSTKSRKTAKTSRLRFFGGKGGVGKTTLAAARAVQLADEGARTLIISTDPAHSLMDALSGSLNGLSLEAVELDAAGALDRWLSPKKSALKIIAERGTYFDRDDLDELLDLSLPGIDELIGLVEISRAARRSAAAEIIVDTAPTGHTLRLFEMPDTLQRIADVFDTMQAKHRYMKESIAGRYRADATDEVIASIAEEGVALASLIKDAGRCRFSWVLIPTVLAVEESLDGIAALEKMGVAVDEVIVNQLTPKPSEKCAYCSSRIQEERRALAPIQARITARIFSLDEEPRGLDALRGVF